MKCSIIVEVNSEVLLFQVSFQDKEKVFQREARWSLTERERSVLCNGSARRFMRKTQKRTPPGSVPTCTYRRAPRGARVRRTPVLVSVRGLSVACMGRWLPADCGPVSSRADSRGTVGVCSCRGGRWPWSALGRAPVCKLRSGRGRVGALCSCWEKSLAKVPGPEVPCVKIFLIANSFLKERYKQQYFPFLAHLVL